MITALALALTGCSAASNAAPSDEPTHGFVAGAIELAEPQPKLAILDPDGELALLDLLTEESSVVATLDEVSDLSTDGRFVFASSASTGDVTIVDSGSWTVDHGDHFHYYATAYNVIGTVSGKGAAAVASDDSHTAIWFASSGDGVILDAAALAAGAIEKVGRIESPPHDGVLVPFAGVVLGSVGDGIQLYEGDGSSSGEPVECAEADGSITTRVGVVFGCLDGAVLATENTDGSVEFEFIPYPPGTDLGDRAREFDNRAGRPAVAAIAGTRGAWVLDTRQRHWTLIETELPLVRVSAVGDDAHRVVAIDSSGRVLVLDASTGATVAATEPLLATELGEGLELEVDASRAYVNAAASGVVYEIDYADGARIARVLEPTGAPVFVVETGR